MAYAAGGQRQQRQGTQGDIVQRLAFNSTDGRLGIAQQQGLEGLSGTEDLLNQSGRIGTGEAGSSEQAGNVSDTCGLANADGGNSSTEWEQCCGKHGLGTASGNADGTQGNRQRPEDQRLGNASGGGCGIMRDEAQPGSGRHVIGSSWAGSQVIQCRDGKTRRIPLEPALFPLADGVPGRVGLLRGAGNAIVPQTAAEFIMACEDVLSSPIFQP